jgi:hypothetical protein
MYDWVVRHHFYLMTFDSNFLWRWTRMTAVERENHFHNLFLIDKLRKDLERSRQDLSRLHVETSKLLERAFASAPQLDFPKRPTAPEWILFARDEKKKKRSYACGLSLLTSFLAECPVAARLYGGIKNRSSIEAKIDVYSKGGELDLNDVIRFRIVLPDLNDMSSFCAAFAESFHLYRCRNYYLQPRNGEDDPYRAVHYEIVDTDGNFIEVQAQSALREAVGLADHSLVLKKCIAFINHAHREWLRNISFVANVLDHNRFLSGLKTSTQVHRQRFDNRGFRELSP